MRILHVTNTYTPVRNGVTASVSGWVAALRDAGHDVAVWTVASQPSRDEGVVESKGVVEIVSGFPLPLHTMPPKEIAGERWDVVHAHHPVILGPSALTFARKSGAAFVATVHSDYVAYVDSYAASVGMLARPVVRRRVRHFFQSADTVFAPSPSIAKAVSSWGVTRPVLPTLFPIDRSSFGMVGRKEARERLGIEAATPLALYAGRIAADKRVGRLLEEFKTMLSRVPRAVLALVGDGPLREKVAHQAAPLGASVVMQGELVPSEVGLWYAAADVFVSASPNEVGPLALIEAALCGTPAVAFDVPGFCDRIENGRTGLLAEGRPGELGRAVAELLVDRERAHGMGEAAATRFADHNPSASARSLLEAYESAVEMAAARSAERAASGYRPSAERS